MLSWRPHLCYWAALYLVDRSSAVVANLSQDPHQLLSAGRQANAASGAFRCQKYPRHPPAHAASSSRRQRYAGADSPLINSAIAQDDVQQVHAPQHKRGGVGLREAALVWLLERHVYQSVLCSRWV